MAASRNTISFLRGPTAVAALAAMLGGCASTRLDAQWSDPQLAAGSLRDARVMVVCESDDPTLQRLCQDEVSAELVARGATPIVAPDGTGPQTLEAARRAGARAVMTHHVTLAAAQPGPAVSIGLGAFRIGGGVSGGVGVTTPIGVGQTRASYALSSRLTAAESGRLLWTAAASSPPSPDVKRQLSELTKAVFEAADKAQLF